MFRLGSFAGGVAKGGLDTYSSIKELQRAEERDKRERERADREKALFDQQQDERRKLQEAAMDTYGRVGKDAYTGDLQKDTGVGASQAQALKVDSGDVDFDRAVAASTADALRQNAQRQGAEVPELSKLTREQAAEQYASRLYAIDPTKAQQAELGGLQIKGSKQQLEKGGFELKTLKRNDEIDNKFQGLIDTLHQKTATTMDDIKTVAETGGMKGLVDKFGPELKKAYGYDIALVGNNIVAKDSKGKVVQTISSLGDAVASLEGHIQQQFGKQFEQSMMSSGLFKSPAELASYLKSRRDEARADREQTRKDTDTASAIDYRAKHGRLFEAQSGYYDRGGAAANRQTAGQVMEEKIDALAKVYIEADPRMDPKVARQRAAQVLTRDPDAKPTVTSADLTNFLDKQQGAIVSKDKNTGKAIRLGDLPLSEQRTIAMEILGGKTATPISGALPDLGEGGLGKPGAPSAPAPASPQTAKPQGALPLQQRLAAAINADNQGGTRSNFRALSDEVAQKYSLMSQQAATLRAALPKVPPESRAILEGRLAAIEEDFPIMENILAQRQAQREQGLLRD